MLLTAKLKLLADKEQAVLLGEFMERYNQACNKVSTLAFHDREWNRSDVRSSAIEASEKSSDCWLRRPFW
jgi:hypothetical protein